MYLVQVAAVGYKPRTVATTDSTELMDKASPNLSTTSKSSSLPGYNNRTFHDAYNSSQIATPAAYRSPALPSKETAEKAGKKKKWTGWSGFFRRNKSSQPSAPGNSSDEAGHLASGQKVSARSEESNHVVVVATSPSSPLRYLHPPAVRNVVDRSPVVDTLSPLQSDLSTSQTSLSRRERRDAILARAQARRTGGGGGSSSDEADANPSPSYRRHLSQESLTSNGSSSRARSRISRTERYFQRRSRDEDSLRKEMRLASPSYVDYDRSVHPSSSRRWLLTSASPGPWGGGAAHPEAQQRVGESPVTLRKPTYNNNNNCSPVVGRVQSALVANPKLSTPPPPPPRNPLKKSYLLQSGEAVHSSVRPTSYSFGEVRQQQQQQLQQQVPSLHDYQNVDQNGRLVPTHLTSPVQRRAVDNSPQRNRHHSAFFPMAKSPSSPFQAPKTPEQERSKPPPWLSAGPKSPVNPPPVREFWRSKDAQQQTPPMKSARERLAPFTATGNALVGVNGSGVIPPTPRRVPISAHNNNNNSSNNNNNQPQQHHVRELSQLKPSNDRHLEQAICELEQIYRSLRLEGDEDLLDRAERRDLPTAHQQLIQQQYVCSGSESGGDPLGHGGITSDLDTMMNWSISGSFENVANGERPRTPSSRRSAIPDKVADDMAVRRLAAAARKSQANDPHQIAAQSGSYLLMSPSLAAAEEHDGVSSRSGSTPDEPDVILDDVAYRQIRQANQMLKVCDPQPPFGIPIGPLTPASPSDYLHSSVTPEQKELRPLLHPTKYPDLVRDDLAFRNLRKDAGQQHHLPAGPVNTEKLDDLLKESGSATKSLRKKRAVRSLSANIAQLIRKDAARPSGGGGVIDFNRNPEAEEEEEEDERYISLNPFDTRAQSLSDLLDDSPTFNVNNNNNIKQTAKTPRAVKQRSGLKRVGKSAEADDVDSIIVERQVRPSASWVERAHLGGSTETLTAVERVPALAKLYPTSGLVKSPKPSIVQQQQPDHLNNNSRQVDNNTSGQQPTSFQLALKPPTGAAAAADTTPSPSGHCWEESPLFQSQPQFHFTRSVSPANSSDSGQVSCCAREVRQILHQQIRQEEREREERLSQGRRTSRTADPAELRQENKAAIDRGVSSKGRPLHPSAPSTASSRENPVARKSSSGGRKMSNNNETGGDGSALADKRDERIARYKEERRKQLQARHQAATAAGVGDHSSSSDDVPHHEDQSYAKYKHRKQMQRQQLESRPVEQQPESGSSNITDLANSNLSNSAGIKRFIKRESPLSEENNGAATNPVRINRAARLRAAAASATPPPPPPAVEEKPATQRTKRLSVPLMEISCSPVVADGGTVDAPQEPVVLRQKPQSSSSSPSLQVGNREKDKSTKRKSNLNRALTDEQIVGQIDCQDDVGKRIRRRRADLAISASSADTDMSSSVDNIIGRRTEAAASSRQSPQPTDLRANLRKTNQPPAFIRPPDIQNIENVMSSPVTTNSLDKSQSSSPYPSSVPWRTGKVAAAATASSPSREVIKTEELTARIEALTAMAHQTVAKVDRLTSTPTPEATNGAHPPATGSVKAVTSKLLSRAYPTTPTTATATTTTSPQQQSAIIINRNRITAKNEAVANNSSPVAVKLSPAVASAQQQQQQQSTATKNRLAATTTTIVNRNDKPLAAASGLVSRANNASAVAGRNKTADQDTTTYNATTAVDSVVQSNVKAVQGILKKKVDASVAEPPPPKAARPEASADLYPVLRVEEDNVVLPSDPVSILKKRFEEPELAPSATTTIRESSPEATPHSILKRPLSRDGSAESGRSQSPVDPQPILKRSAPSPSPVATSEVASSGDPRPILKKRSSAEDPSALISDTPRPILKKKSSTDDELSEAASTTAVAAVAAAAATHRPILKSVRRTSSDQSEFESHLRSLRRNGDSRESPSREQPDTGANEPEEERPRVEEEGEGQVQEQEEEERQLSVAERISCMELQSGAPVAAAAAAPWRTQSRPPTVPANNNGIDHNPAAPVAWRRKSLDVNHISESNRNGNVTEAVNRHVDPAHAQTNGTTTTTTTEQAASTDNNNAVTKADSEEVKQEITSVAIQDPKPPTEGGTEDTEASGLDRIRGILRRKSTESSTEMKSILRSKSPSISSMTVEQPVRSILKKHSPEETESVSSSSSGSSENLVVPAENDLAAQMLNVELEAKSQPQVKSIMQQQHPNGHATERTERSIETREKIETISTSSVVQQSSVRRETETIIVESEGSSSGTETTTHVTFRLGGGNSASTAATTVKQSQTTTKIKSHKAVMEELGEVSLASRLAALQKSGDTEWRKRIAKPAGISSPSSATEADEAANSDGDIPATKNTIAERLKVLETAQKGWRMRVHEPDASRFTVAGKMGQRPVSVHGLSPELIKPISPLLDRKKKAPIPLIVKASDGSAADESSPGTPSTDDAKPPFNRSTSDPNGAPPKATHGLNGKAAKVTSRIVSVPRPDDETFTSFFAASEWSLASSSTHSVTTLMSTSSFSDVTAEDFDQIAISRDLVIEKRSVHVQRRKKNASRNPIKSLILRTDMLRDEYEEVDTGVAEREVQRIKLEQLAKNKNSHLAVEALAGLASKEDFSSIALKSAKDQTDKESSPKTYLLQVKGRRQIQTRLVEPTYKSINSGDCFILVTPNDVIQFIGRYANVIERSRSSEVAQRIVLKKDLGSFKASQVQIIEEDKVGSNSFFGASKRLWTALGRTEAEQSISPAGPPEEDEIYESAVATTNGVWELDGEQLKPREDTWGVTLQTDILDPNKVMVFDFGSEMFVWSGKMAPLEDRKKAMDLAKELWNRGYDYSECAINPVFQRVTPPEQSKGQQRPEWALLRSAKQHMEPVLFREKFFDWPDKSGLIKIKSQDSEEKTTTINMPTDISSLERYDARSMLDHKLDDPDLELEGSHLGRGIEYYDEAERRLQQISTLSVKVWHLLDYEKVLLDEASYGQFHSRDTYIIRWQYRITITGKDLKGQPSVHGLLGRDRFCYFIWHGAQAPPTDQGASALKTVELDEERGPHVRVQQGHEPPAFLAIFQGRMAVHGGKRGEADDNSGWRLYFVRGEKDEEAHLLQVRRSVQALRSRASLLLVNQSTGTIFLWHGAKSLKHTRQVAACAAAALKQHRPPELNLRNGVGAVVVKEQYEGAESREFWEGLGHQSRVADRSLYHSLAEQPKENRFDHTARLFHLTSWTGQFRADEVAPSSRYPQLPCPYPFVQEDLYSANQPTLFMLDNEHEVWLWQGWWPEQPDTDNTNTGSGKLRLAAERRCAMETAIEYCRLKADNEDRSPPPAYLVSAGLEPLAFIALFPDWTVDDRVAQLNVQDGKSAGEMQSIQEVLDRLKRTTYALSELQVRPPPEGVDPTKLESYLTDDDFQDTMGMTKPDFYALPAWRQSQLRKETGLF